MSSQPLYTRQLLIDTEKESKIQSTLLRLAFEPTSCGWKVDEKEPWIATKINPADNRPIVRSSRKNHSTLTLADMHEFYQAGYNSYVRKKDHSDGYEPDTDDIQHHIDDDHDICYNPPWPRESELTARGIISPRDFQNMHKRFRLHNYTATDGVDYDVVGRFSYTLPKEHVLYTKPPKNTIRVYQEFAGSIYYQPVSETDKTRWSGIHIHSGVNWGGWMPHSVSDILTIPGLRLIRGTNNPRRPDSYSAVIIRMLRERKLRNIPQRKSILGDNIDAVVGHGQHEQMNDVYDHDHESRFNDHDSRNMLYHPVYLQLIMMGYDPAASLHAAKLHPNDVNAAMSMITSTRDPHHKIKQDEEYEDHAVHHTHVVDTKRHIEPWPRPAQIDHDAQNTETVSTSWHRVYRQLIMMGFDDEAAVHAAKLHPNDVDAAAEAVITSKFTMNRQHEYKQDEDEEYNAVHHPHVMDTRGYIEPRYRRNQQLRSSWQDIPSPRIPRSVPMPANNDAKNTETVSAEKSMQTQFEKFLESLNMAKYMDLFKQNECCDMASIPFFDDDFIKNDIGIGNKILRKRFLAKCEEIKQEMNRFRNEHGINHILCNRLAKYGVVTVEILCNEIKSKEQLKQKYNIGNQRQCELLWSIIQKYENQREVVQEEGTLYI